MLITASFVRLAAAETATAEAVRWDLLSSELEGFGSETTGGLGGLIYDVTDARDYAVGETAVAGTLRYGIDRYGARPLWIRFAKLGDGPQKIVLKRTLYLPSHVTLDGRKADVSIVTEVDWTKYEEVWAGSRNQCAIRDTSTTLLTTLLAIRGSYNVIITHLKLGRDGYKSPWEDDATLDKECLGDMIAIYNKPTVATYTTKIWLNHLSIGQCGDGCVDITRPANKAEFISISNSKFSQTDKTMLLGSPYDLNSITIPAGEYYPRVSLYRNLFDGVNERNPRASSAIVHAYNNIYSNWGSYIVAAEASKVFFEGNMLNPGARTTVINQTLSNSVYAFDNTVSNSPNFPDYPDYIAYRNHWLSNLRFTVANSTGLGNLDRAGWVPDTY